MKEIFTLLMTLAVFILANCSNDTATPAVFSSEEISQVSSLISQIPDGDKEFFYQKMKSLTGKSILQSNQEAVKKLAEYQELLNYFVDGEKKNWAMLFDLIIKHSDDEEFNNASLLLLDVSLPEYQAQLDKVNSSKLNPVSTYYTKELLKLKSFGGVEDEKVE